MAEHNLVTAEHANAPKQPPPSKLQRIPARVRQAVNLIATGECTTQKAACARVGLSEQHLSRMLAKVHVRAFMAQESARTIAGATMRASRRLVELIDAESEHVAAKVSERILTSEGILKSDQGSIAVNVDVRAGFVIDLSNPSEHTLPTNPLIEHDKG
jgi:hypothetical protein